MGSSEVPLVMCNLRLYKLALIIDGSRRVPRGRCVGGLLVFLGAGGRVVLAILLYPRVHSLRRVGALQADGRGALQGNVGQAQLDRGVGVEFVALLERIMPGFGALAREARERRKPNLTLPSARSKLLSEQFARRFAGAGWRRGAALARRLFDSGNGLYVAEHYEDALSVREAELAMQQRLGASEHYIRVAQGNLASTYDALGRLADALLLQREVYAMLRVLEPENLNTFFGRPQLGKRTCKH